MSLPFPARGLYAITPEHLQNADLLQATEQALKGGAQVIQFRDKHRSRTERLALAQLLLALCHQFQVPFIVNDDAELAQSCHADGVHLGQEDGSIEYARTLLGPQAIIGISCYGELERARKAQTHGANYVAFGRCFPSKTKPHAKAIDIGVLKQAQANIELPLVAIGGITADNATDLIEAGADLIACVEGVFSEPNIKDNAKKLSHLFL